MPRRQKVDEKVVIDLYSEIGNGREVARQLGLHENTVYGILKRNRHECLVCGQPVNPGNKYCQSHLEHIAKRTKEKRRKLKAQGKCVVCGQTRSVGSRMYCEKHWIESNAKNRERYKEQKYGAPNKGVKSEVDRMRGLRSKYGEGGVEAWNRSNGSCTLCGVDYTQKAIHVHHIDQNPKNNSPLNLVTLCFNCHRMTHLLIEHPDPETVFLWLEQTYPNLMQPAPGKRS